MCYQNATAWIAMYQEMVRFPEMQTKDIYEPPKFGKEAADSCCLNRVYKEDPAETAKRPGCAAISVNHKVYISVNILYQLII
jgi:hypothetical protein